MEQKNTVWPWPTSAPAACTDAASPELKSTFSKGLDTENFVANFLTARSCQILKHRWRTPFGELDLLVESARGNLVVIEVKALSNWDRLLFRLTAKQRQRLQRIRFFVENQYQREVLLQVAYVGPENKIAFFDT